MKFPVGAFALACVMASGPVLARGDEDTKVPDASQNFLASQVEATLVGHGVTGIHVEAWKGNVQLAGFVRTPAERRTAADLAGTVKGVTRVLNQVVLQGGERDVRQVVDDGIMENEVTSSLSDNDGTNAFDINVDVRRGVVLLSGFVHSDTERQAALRTAEGIDGVVNVIDAMDVVSQA